MFFTIRKGIYLKGCFDFTGGAGNDFNRSKKITIF
jgi:hypothetical protein